MSKSKEQRRRDKIRKHEQHSKQLTLNSIAYGNNFQKKIEEITARKTILINCVSPETKEDELMLRVDFSLLPSSASFSKVKLDLFFEGQILLSVPLGILHSQLLGDSLVYPAVLEMAGIAAGKYKVKVEMYEPWSDCEKLHATSLEILIEHVPFNRKARLVKIPTVRSVTGSDLTVVSSSAKTIYEDLERDSKKESESKRDEW
jgi:hypothetical protein